MDDYAKKCVSDFKTFVDLVDTMRQHQRHYFKTKDRDSMIEAKVLEKRVDAAVAEILKEGQIVWPEEAPHDP